MSQCSFFLEAVEFAFFLKCFNQNIKTIKFSCTQNKVVVGGINQSKYISMFVQTIPTLFESEIGRFDIQLPISSITKIFNIYRSNSKESLSEKVYITITTDGSTYNIVFLEKMLNKGKSYDVKSQISGKNQYDNEIIDIQNQKLPVFLRKIKCPVQILSKTISRMLDYYTDVTLICTKSSLIVQNQDYSVEICDETIFTNIDSDSYIQIKLQDLDSILDTSMTKYIDIYFTGENLLCLSDQHDQYLYTYFCSAVSY